MDFAINPTRTEFGDVFDFGISANDFTKDDGLRTAIVISLFTDARAELDEIQDGQNLRGWWGDTIAEITGDKMGSKLWLLEREKETAQVLTRAEGYAKDALKWLIDDKVASKVAVAASFPVRGFLSLSVFITRPSGETLNFIFDSAWKVEGAT